MIYITTSIGIFEWDEKETFTKKTQDRYYSLNRWQDGWVVVHTTLKSDTQEGRVTSSEIRLLDKDFNITNCYPLGDDIVWAHQASLHGNILVFTDTGNDRICFYDLVSQAYHLQVLTEYCPPGKKTHQQTRPQDQRHVNSILFEGEVMHVLCHCYAKSYMVSFARNIIINRVDNIGTGAHDLFRWYDGELWTCSSLDGAVQRVDGSKSIAVNGFPRGVIVEGNRLYVGSSARKDHPDHNKMFGVFKIENDSVIFTPINSEQPSTPHLRQVLSLYKD